MRAGIVTIHAGIYGVNEGYLHGDEMLKDSVSTAFPAMAWLLLSSNSSSHVHVLIYCECKYNSEL